MDRIDWYGEKWLLASRAAQDIALSATADALVNHAKRLCPVFLGNLRRSISRTPPEDGQQGQRVIMVGFSDGNAAAWKYAMSIERGRAAGKMPPVDALIKWVERKLKIGMVANGLNKRGLVKWKKSRSANREQEIRSVAFVVARSIGEKGTKARPFMLPAFMSENQRIGARFKKALGEQMKAHGIESK